MSDLPMYEVTVSVKVLEVEDVKEAIEVVEESWHPPEWAETSHPNFEKVETVSKND